MDTGKLDPISQGSHLLMQKSINPHSDHYLKIDSLAQTKISTQLHRSHFPTLNSEKIIKPKALKIGDTLGIFTPSWPANVLITAKYLHALQVLKEVGFNYIEGSVTRQMMSQGYRSASPQERAAEFMELISNPQVHGLIATIGGANSASMIPFLDFNKIRESRKVICGYSDMTSLHLSILAYSGLSTIYGVALVPSFGEYPSIMKYSLDSFLLISTQTQVEKLKIDPPSFWSRHFIDAQNPNWKTIVRETHLNDGWKILCPGQVTAPIVVVNLETLVTSAGTSYFPVVKDKILILEETAAIFNKTERHFRQLERMGVFNQIKGLILSKPSEINNEGAPFTHEQLILEIVEQRDYPIVSNFDCGHTFPMINLAQEMIITVCANQLPVEIYFEEAGVVSYF